ncbi:MULTISPECIES: hypothetical protein [Salinibaculum]|uniref:hypothetical protein n=1 Tax=Salinibaculum TaxID=2732368 RepID=UPI0030CB77DE
MTDLHSVYRHDAHKFTGESHRLASETFAGVAVNQAVPHGADADAAALSRPPGNPTPTVEQHVSRFRLSVLTGDSELSRTEAPDDHAVRELLTESDSERAHERWLESDVAALVNESPYHPYTSLKYHTLLVGALYHAYRQGATFGDLTLAVDASEHVVPYRTVFAGDSFSLRITPETAVSGARLGSTPRQSWASVWSRLPEHPLDTGEKWHMALDANLRRIRSWSTALQYIEDFLAWRAPR